VTKGVGGHEYEAVAGETASYADADWADLEMEMRGVRCRVAFPASPAGRML